MFGGDDLSEDFKTMEEEVEDMADNKEKQQAIKKDDGRDDLSEEGKTEEEEAEDQVACACLRRCAKKQTKRKGTSNR